MNNKRILTLSLFLLLTWVFMVSRVFQIQMVKSDHYAEIAEKQSMRRTILPPKRGEIFDRKNRALIQNAKVTLKYKEGSHEKQRNLKRVAPHGRLAGQVLGNIGKDGYGQLGLEYNQDNSLRGQDGWSYTRYDVRRKYYPGVKEKIKEPISGQNIVSTIDIDIQKISEQALERGINRTGALKGVAVVINPHTGDILAMANYPLYNPNRRNQYDLKGWKNMAISKVYEPGSTFKIITAAAGLEEHVITPETQFNAEGGRWKINGATITDTKPKESLSFSEAMAYSSNIVMAKTALKLTPTTFYKYIRSFGFGFKTGIDLPAEEGGHFQKVKYWSKRSQVTLAWGQELSVTPLQITMAVGAVANGGYLMQPRIILKKLDQNGELVESVPVKKIRRVITEQTASQLRTMLQGVVDFGTAQGIHSDRYTIAGKTGTVEKIDQNTGKYVKGKFHSSFVGMVPADAPEYVCLVLIDEPQVDKYGGSAAGPVFKEIMDRLISNSGSELLARYENNKKLNNQSDSLTTLTSTPPETAGSQTPTIDPKKQKVTLASVGALSPFSQFFKAKISDDSKALAPKPTGPPVQVSSNKMPNVKNLSLRDALLKLNSYDIEIEFKGLGHVVQQYPKEDTQLKKGMKCTIVLGSSS